MADEKETVEAKVRTIRRATRKECFAEEKMQIVLEGLRGESKFRKLCPRERIPTQLLGADGPHVSVPRMGLPLNEVVAVAHHGPGAQTLAHLN